MKPKSRCLVDVSPVTRGYFQVQCFYQGGIFRFHEDFGRPPPTSPSGISPLQKWSIFWYFLMFTSRIFENNIQQVKYTSRFFANFSDIWYFPKNIGNTMLNFLCFEARGHTFSGKSLVRRPVPVDSEGSSDELERMGGEGGEMIWVKVKETSQKKNIPSDIHNIHKTGCELVLGGCWVFSFGFLRWLGFKKVRIVWTNCLLWEFWGI